MKGVEIGVLEVAEQFSIIIFSVLFSFTGLRSHVIFVCAWWNGILKFGDFQIFYQVSCFQIGSSKMENQFITIHWGPLVGHLGL